MKLLLAHPDIEVNPKDDSQISPLQWCVDRDKIETAKVLLDDSRTDVSSSNLLGQTALHWAVSKRKIEFVKLLMTHPDIDINQADRNGVTPLLLAAKTGNTLISKILLNHPMINVQIADRVFLYIQCGVLFFHLSNTIYCCI